MREISDFMAMKIEKIAFLNEGSSNFDDGIEEVAELAKLEKATEAIPIIRKNEELMNGLEESLSLLLDSQRELQNEVSHLPQFLYPEAKMDLSKYPNRWEVKLIYAALVTAAVFSILFELKTLPSYLDALGIAEPGSFAIYLPGLATSIWGIAKNSYVYLHQNASALNLKKTSAVFLVAFAVYIISTVCTPTIATDIWAVTADVVTYVGFAINLVTILSATVWILTLASMITYGAMKLREALRQGEIVTNPAFRNLQERIFSIDKEIQSTRQSIAHHRSINDSLLASVKLYMNACCLAYRYYLKKLQNTNMERKRLLECKQQHDQKLIEWREQQSIALQQEIERINKH